FVDHRGHVGAALADDVHEQSRGALIFDPGGVAFVRLYLGHRDAQHPDAPRQIALDVVQELRPGESAARDQFAGRYELEIPICRDLDVSGGRSIAWFDLAFQSMNLGVEIVNLGLAPAQVSDGADAEIGRDDEEQQDYQPEQAAVAKRLVR